MRQSFCMLAVTALLTACGGDGTRIDPKDAAQVIYKNGDIITLDQGNSVA
ncbi:hypothetical protein [Diaphorobacter sp.]|nr:hypothetical protein [Diaphorobacter sp.]